MTDRQEPVWLSRPIVEAIHGEQLQRFGGAAGLRDEGMLESALSRPLNKHLYEDAGLLELAASYAFGLAKNHPFVDGNKRVAFLSMYTFLGINGIWLDVPDVDVVALFQALAAGEVDEDGLVRWLQDRLAAQG